MYLYIWFAKNDSRCATHTIDARYNRRDYPNFNSKYTPRVYDA